MSRFVKKCTRSFHASAEQLIKRYVDLPITPVINGLQINPSWKQNGTITTKNPSTGEDLITVPLAAPEEISRQRKYIDQAKSQWISTPAPKRGEIIGQIRDAIKAEKSSLATVISLEMGKIYTEALGEVQEFIDICDYAVGLSRQVDGRIFPSERRDHFMMERFNPIGTVGVISAFNFPMAVFGWNFALATVCGNPVLWKPAPSTSLCAIALTNVIHRVLKENNIHPALCTTILGGPETGMAMAKDPHLSLLSFTGSTSVGKLVGSAVQERMGKSILELGGNNAAIVMPDADLDNAVKSCLFAAIGTTGQRCTSLRRLFLHQRIYDDFLSRLIGAYEKISIGDPFGKHVQCGPVHRLNSIDMFSHGVEKAVAADGKVLHGGHILDRPGYFVEPTIIEMSSESEVVQHEVFSPILYVHKITNLDEAIKYNNSVKQGLSSSLFTRSMEDTFRWISPNGSDCGIVNVNISTTGAEIGGAFGGEKESGMGRESGSDSWKQYCKRQTCTINHGRGLELAQGVQF